MPTNPADILALRPTIMDYNQLQEAFRQKQAQEALQNQALINQANGILTPKDQQEIALRQQGMQDQEQNHKDALGMQLAQMQQAMAIAQQASADRRSSQAESMAMRKDQFDQTMAQKQDQIDQKRDLKKANDGNLLNNATTAIDQQMQGIDDLLKHPGLDANLGLRGAVLPVLPGSQGADAKALMQNVNANAFIGALGQMKSQSATGASGLGALSEREGDKVQAAAAALQASQSDAAFRQNALKYKNELAASKQRLIGGYNSIYNGGNPAAPVAAPVAAPAQAPTDFSHLWGGK